MYRFGEMYEKRGEISKNAMLGYMEPFMIAQGVYFVGTYQASTHLIDTGDGLILIDPGYSSTAHIVVDSIHRLGFDPRDIKYILNTHWHGDHVEATAALRDLCGAKTVIGKDDAERAERYFKPDILVSDGDVLELGNIRMELLITPGHTKGTVSPFFEITDGGNVYRVGMFGGAGVNTLARGSFDFEGCRRAYLESVLRLKKERVDVFIGNHTWNNGTYEKFIENKKDGKNRFIDSEEWGKFLSACEGRVRDIIERDGE